MAQPRDVASEGPGRLTFRRSALRQGTDLGCGCIAAVGFAAAGLAMAAEYPIALIPFGFFAAFAAFATIAEAQRGGDTRVVEVEPAGIWLPEMEFLRWSEVAEVRLESIRGIASSEVAATKRYRRLGVVPRDGSLRPTVASRGAWGFLDAYVRLMRRMAPELRLGGQDLAPFAVSELELSSDSFDRLLAAVRRYVDVVDADQRRAIEHAPRWRPTAAASPDLAVLDAAIAAPPAVAPSAVTPSTADGGDTNAESRITAPAPSAPTATFVAADAAHDLRSALLQVVAPLFVLLGITAALPAEWFARLGVLAWIGGLAIALVVITPGAIKLVRRLQIRSAPPVVLRIGPDGVWLPDMGLVAWPAVAAVRTERAGFVRSQEGPAIERWRLVVVPGNGAGGTTAEAYGVTSDALTARFDDVLDLVRVYHPVEEGG